MPTEFLQKQETEIILLQEVTPIEIDLIRGYNAYTNVGINKCGNVMLTRQIIKVTNHAITIRVGNGIVLPGCLYIKYVYTGSSNRQERKFFKIWTHKVTAFTVSNNDHRGRIELYPDKYRLQ